MINSFNGH